MRATVTRWAREFAMYGLGAGAVIAALVFAVGIALGYTPGVSALIVAMVGVGLSVLAVAGDDGGPDQGHARRRDPTDFVPVGRGDDGNDGSSRELRVYAIVFAGVALYGFLGMAVALSVG